MIAIIDFDLGNLHSVQRAVRHMGGQSIITDSPAQIAKADKLILPGVGSFKAGMDNLQKKELLDPIRSRVECGISLLGICLGMQLLLDHSEENGSTIGLGFIPGNVFSFRSLVNFDKKTKVPHINWCSLQKRDKPWDNTILEGVEEDEDCYFVHSFCVQPEEEKHILAISCYGGCEFSSVIKYENITGCQFHPEKSGEVGLKIIDNFIKNY